MRGDIHTREAATLKTQRASPPPVRIDRFVPHVCTLFLKPHTQQSTSDAASMKSRAPYHRGGSFLSPNNRECSTDRVVDHDLWRILTLGPSMSRPLPFEVQVKPQDHKVQCSS